jgi:cation diffusion facilitator family transporter
MQPNRNRRLQRIAATSIGVGGLVLLLKLLAWWVTGSIALLSDALESLVNVATAVTTLLAVRYAARPVDRTHPYGHAKAELLSAAIEGGLIIAAALVILQQAIAGLASPPVLTSGPAGLALNAAASVVNGLWCIILIREGRRHLSPALEADGHHLLSDVISSLGVLGGTLAALLTGWAILDPATACLVALHVLLTGAKVLWSAGRGLMDEAPPEDIMTTLRQTIAGHAQEATDVHDLRARRAGRQIFADVHLVVPAGMTVDHAHGICDRIEAQLAKTLPDCSLTIHIEPDPQPARG